LNPFPDGQVPAGFVRIWCDEPDLAIQERFGAELPKITTDEGPWDVVPRANQVSMTIPKGMGPWRLDLNILIDGLREQKGQEIKIGKLYDCWRGTKKSPPGILHVAGLPEVDPSMEWVIDTIDQGDYLRRNDMHRIRQDLTIHFIEYISPQYLPMAKGALMGAKKATVVTLKVKRGDTPATIARRRGVKWTTLRELNPGVIYKANQNLLDGSKIRVPAKKDSNASQSSRTK
jgi:hypothetical protein